MRLIPGTTLALGAAMELSRRDPGLTYRAYLNDAGQWRVMASDDPPLTQFDAKPLVCKGTYRGGKYDEEGESVLDRYARTRAQAKVLSEQYPNTTVRVYCLPSGRYFTRFERTRVTQLDGISVTQVAAFHRGNAVFT
jgi:hypothetical protein